MLTDKLYLIKYGVKGSYYDGELHSYSRFGITVGKDLGDAATRIEEYYGNELIKIICLEYLSDSDIVEFKQEIDDEKIQIDTLFDNF